MRARVTGGLLGLAYGGPGRRGPRARGRVASARRRPPYLRGSPTSSCTTVPRPTSISFTPDGRGVITTQTGTVRILTGNGNAACPRRPSPSARRVCTNNERGAVGVCRRPAVRRPTGSSTSTGRSRSSAAAAPPASNDAGQPAWPATCLADNNVINPASEMVLLDNIPSPTGFHNSGDLEFGKDGFLYVTRRRGRPGSRRRAPAWTCSAGKVLRITRDGGIPRRATPSSGPGPTPAASTAATPNGQTCQEIYATGLRNPFRMALQPERAPASRCFVNDVGQNNYEEVNRLRTPAPTTAGTSARARASTARPRQLRRPPAG